MKRIFILEPGDKFCLDDKAYRITREQKLTAGEQNDDVVLFGPHGNNVKIPARTVILVLLDPQGTQDDNFRTLFPGDFGHQDGNPIRAEIRDDNNVEMEFDAQLFFAKANDEQIKYIHEGGYNNFEDYEANDEIGDFFEDNPRIALRFSNRENSGYFISLNREDVTKWLQNFRPALAQKLFPVEVA